MLRLSLSNLEDGAVKPKALGFQLTPNGSKLTAELTAAEQLHNRYASIDPGLAERLSGLWALWCVIDYFAELDVELNPLLRLRDALSSYEATAMFAPPPKGRGRRPQSPNKHKIKGMLAGMVRVRQNAGESRPRQVLEWFDKYSVAGGQPGLGRDAYLLVEQSTPFLLAYEHNKNAGLRRYTR